MPFIEMRYLSLIQIANKFESMEMDICIIENIELTDVHVDSLDLV